MRRMYSKPQLLEAVEQESKVNGIKVFEDIKDKDGHPRFIEGDIEKLESVTTITKLFGKWSLSGTHLMIVFAFSFLDTTVIASGRITEYIELPQWIKDKIVVLFGTTDVDRKTVIAFADDSTAQNVTMYLEKDTQNRIYLYVSGFTATKDRQCRAQFDLLIDNE